MTITGEQWQAAKNILKHTLPGAYQNINRATLHPSPNGAVHIGVADNLVELYTARLSKPIASAIWQVTGEQPEIIFESTDAGGTVSPPAPAPAPQHVLQTFDFLPVWRKTGYSQMAHYVTKFWVPYLSPNVFATWNALAAADTRPVQHPENRWTLPREFSYRELARHIGARSHKTISGRKDECGISRKHRLINHQPITETCTLCPHPVHQLTPGNDGDNRCRYWRPGTMEILYAEKLLALDVRFAPGNPLPLFTISVYRVLPLLTPLQAEQLPAATRREHTRWLRRHEQTTRLTVADWQAITAATLVPRQPGYNPPRLTGSYQFNRILAEIGDDRVHESTDLGRTAPSPDA